METKAFIINSNDNIVEHSNAVFSTVQRTTLNLKWNMGRKNATHISSGWYGDSVINPGALESDGDLILSVGWSDGFAIRRINDDGSFQNIYYDERPANNYNYYTNLTIDRTKKLAYVSTYVYSGIVVYDYSDCFGGSDSVTKVKTITVSNSNIYSDKNGHYYVNGTCLVGKWLYIGPYDKSSTKLHRYNVETDTDETIDVSGYRHPGRYGAIVYEEDTDRLFLSWRENGETWMVTDASSDTLAKCYNLRQETIGLYNDIRTMGAVTCKENPNHLWVGGDHGLIAKIDISNILNGTSIEPVLLQRQMHQYESNAYRGGLQYTQGYHFLNRHPVFGSDLILLNPDRGYFVNTASIDAENCSIVGPSLRYVYGDNYNKKANTIYEPNSDLFLPDYGPIHVKAKSKGGISYWVKSAYGGNCGYKFFSWAESEYPKGLCYLENGHITFGNFKLDSNKNIGSVKLSNISIGAFEPVGTSLTVKVSNNNGSSWEVYDHKNEVTHDFASSGNSLKVRIELSGTPTKTPYINTMGHIGIYILEENGSFNKRYRRRAKLRIRGI